MTTREQDHALEALSLQNNGETLAVRDGYADGALRVTNRRGAHWFIRLDGNVRQSPTGNFSIDWSNHEA
jgi:hypothetical protein